MTGAESESDDRLQHQPTSATLRSARVNRSPDGDPLGASIFLTPEQLSELGFEVRQLNVLDYGVRDGELRLVDTGVENTIQGESAEDGSIPVEK